MTINHTARFVPSVESDKNKYVGVYKNVGAEDGRIFLGRMLLNIWTERIDWAWTKWADARREARLRATLVPDLPTPPYSIEMASFGGDTDSGASVEVTESER